MVLIDDAKDKKNLPTNLGRALWGLLKCCKQLKQYENKADDKNDQMIDIAKNRLRDLYNEKTDMKIEKMQVMASD